MYCTPANGAAQRRARITFDSAGETTNVVAYVDQGSRATPSRVDIQTGRSIHPCSDTDTAYR
jgi:hypothetical protein